MKLKFVYIMAANQADQSPYYTAILLGKRFSDIVSTFLLKLLGMFIIRLSLIFY